MRMRDVSAGPVLMRRRSDSNGNSDVGQDVSDLELDSQPEIPDDVIEERSNSRGPSTSRAASRAPSRAPSKARGRHNGLGTIAGRPSNASSALSSFEGGIAPAISAVLEQGTWVTKHTSKRSKRIKIWLDPNSARVCWHATNHNKSFFIDDVREIRVGADSRYARDDVQVPEEHEGRLISIIYELPERSKGRTIKNMHLMTPDAYITNLWADALNKVTRERIEIMNALSSSTEKSEKSMAMAWRQAMARKATDADESFTLEDARWICRKLEINCSDHTVRTHFTRSDISLSGSLDYAQYRDFVDSFKERKDIQNLYRNIKFGTDIEMDFDTFSEFLRVEQCLDIDKDLPHWEAVFEKYAKKASTQNRLPDAEPVTGYRTMNMLGFQNFLTSSHNAPLLSKKGDVVLDRPLNEYFVSSSHNTYLLGRQVAGASSVEGYISALVKGCRCIEIDCWDGDDGRPMVTHGRTMTTKIPFADCVSVVAKYAFHSTPYPLIVSLEVHCTVDQQLAMVELMKKHWDGIMVLEPLMNDSVTLPSPEELRNKIIIKVKAAEDSDFGTQMADAPNGRSRARSITSTFTRTPSSDPSFISASPLVNSPPTMSPADSFVAASSTPRGSTTSGPTLSPSSSSEDSDHVAAAIEKGKKRKTSKITPELGRLGVYAQGIKYGGFGLQEAKTYNHIFSFSENTFVKLCAKDSDSKTALEKHNMRYLMRVYPGARRIDSSNFNPLHAWRRGVQMAALNWQTYDVHMQVNEAMFAAGSDRLGYVLKPEELRQAKHLAIADVMADDGQAKEKKWKKIVKFGVDIVSAQRLPRPRNQSSETPMNPYIEFEMYSPEDKARGIATGEGGTDASARDGMLGIGSPLRKRTRVVEGNGFDPVFNQPIQMTVETKHTSLIFVRWTVWNSPDGRRANSNNTLLATFTAKLDSLQQGYRHLPLFNPHGEQYRDAKLFVKIRKDAPVTLQHDDSSSSIVEPVPSVNIRSSSPRPIEPLQRSERSWPRRIFSRNPSERRRRGEQFTGSPGDPNASLSRTSSLDRESLR
jgi:phosphatidylinositol phospholipase C delta